MSLKSFNMSFNSSRPLIVEIHKLIELMRTVLSDNRNLCNGIDEAYESTLYDELSLIPEFYEHKIINLLNICKIVINNVDICKINKELNSKIKDASISIETSHILNSMIEKININTKDKIRIKNVITKLNPLLKCFDAMFYNPKAVLNKLSSLRNDGMVDILSL